MKMKRNRRLLAMLMAVVLGISLLPVAMVSADEPANFSIVTPFGELLADGGTRFITLYKQDPVTKMITATVQIQHNSADTRDLVIYVVGVEISYNEARVAPHAYYQTSMSGSNVVRDYNNPNTAYDPALLFTGKIVDNELEFFKYCNHLVNRFEGYSNIYMKRDGTGGVLGVQNSTSETSNALRVAQGQTVNVIEFYFMPVNGTDILDIDMFGYEYVFDAPAGVVRSSPHLINGFYRLEADGREIPIQFNYTLSPASFKVHVERPLAVSADNSARVINGYNSATMEWSDDGGVTYKSGTPVIPDVACTIHVRARGDDAYSRISGLFDDAQFGNYKKYVPGIAQVSFEGEDGPINYIVTFDGNGGTPAEQTRVVAQGASVGSGNMPTRPSRSGHSFKEWNTEQNGTGSVFTDTTPVTGNIRVYAQHTQNSSPPPTTPGPSNKPPPPPPPDDTNIDDPPPPTSGFTEEHIPYINGYPDYSVKPNNPITRAEAAVIFFRLLIDKEKNDPGPSAFKDIALGTWYSQAVIYLTRLGIITGYPDDTFKPGQPITRAEFAAIASRFDQLSTLDNNAFPDITDHWAKDFINSAAAKGWITGYPDRTFRPQQNITRAEVVRIVNTMLNRKILLEDIPVGIIRFTDFNGHWAYTDIVEASNNHDYIRKINDYEIWTLK